MYPFRTQYMVSPLPYTLPSTSSGSKMFVTTRSTTSLQAVVGQGPQTPPGICGLCNLGNTCFMNSVIQCLSNCPPITDYFLKDLHVHDLNIKNPIGNSGEVAKAFGILMKTIWSGSYSYTAPQHFKLAVSKFAPQFCGFQQHDSQELLTFLLDGLHEDLNRIQLKPYIEQKCSSEDHSDQEIANETWNNYKRCNDSLIVDYFHGLLKSRVVCPACERVSITFDPFCSLSLPLPLKKDRVLNVHFVPYDQKMKEKLYKVQVSKKGRVKDICFELRHILRSEDSICSEDMIVARVNESRFYKFYSLEDSVELLNEKDSIHVYDIPTSSKEAKLAVVPVCLLEKPSKEDGSEFSVKYLFGTPVMCVLPTTPAPFNHFYCLFCDRIHRQFFNYPYINSNEKSYKNGMTERECTNEDKTTTMSNSNNHCFAIYLVNMGTNSMTQIKDDYVDTGVFTERIGHQFVALQCSSMFRQKYFTQNPLQSFHNNISVTHKRRVGLQECLDLFTFTEKLGEDNTWYCSKCQAHQRATKKFDLWELPKILIIHLKRFSYTRFQRNKIDTLVDFPLQNLDLSSYVLKNVDSSTNNITSQYYDLIGVCNHFGSLGGGHYTAFAKNKDIYQWYCFDDSNVYQINEENVVTNAAYVLFYMRKDINNTITSTRIKMDKL